MPFRILFAVGAFSAAALVAFSRTAAAGEAAATLKDGTVQRGRLAAETKKGIALILAEEKLRIVFREDLARLEREDGTIWPKGEGGSEKPEIKPAAHPLDQPGEPPALDPPAGDPEPAVDLTADEKKLVDDQIQELEKGLPWEQAEPAAKAIAGLKQAAGPYLAERLASGTLKPGAVRMVIPLLANLGHRKAAPSFENQALRGETTEVRVAACQGLQTLGLRGSISLLAEVLRTGDAETRRAAARALADLDEPLTAPAFLVGMLDTDWGVRDVSRDTFVTLAEKAEFSGQQILSVTQQLSSNPEPEKRLAAFHLIPRLPAEEKELILVRFLKDTDRRVVKAAVKAVRDGKAWPRTDLIQALFKHSDRDIQLLAIGTAGDIKIWEALPDLVELVRSEKKILREAGHAALVQLTGKQMDLDFSQWKTALENGELAKPPASQAP